MKKRKIRIEKAKHGWTQTKKSQDDHDWREVSQNFALAFENSIKTEEKVDQNNSQISLSIDPIFLNTGNWADEPWDYHYLDKDL